jgi:cytochrome c1
MADDPRAALDQFIASLERHFAAASQRRSELDPAVVEAYDALAAAFERYDEALFTAYDEVTPFVLSEEEDEDDDEYDDEDDELDEDLEDLEDLDDLDDDLEDADDARRDGVDRNGVDGDGLDRDGVAAGSAGEGHRS